MLWKILLSESVLKVEEFAETHWFYMPLQWHVWWKQELDKLFFRPRHGCNQSVVCQYTSFDVEGTEMMFDVTEELERYKMVEKIRNKGLDVILEQ